MTSSHVDMKRIGLPLLAVLALAAAGCGSSSSSTSTASSSTASPSNSSTGTSGTASSGGGKTVTIDMKNIQFNPKSATVKVGDTVKWVNQDSAPHNVNGGPLKSPTFGSGGSYTFKVTKPGKISYVCTIHPGMTGTLNVTS